MATTIIITLETTEPPSFIHFHPAFPLLPQRSDTFVDLPFDCFGAKFETILHCLHYARFAPLDQSYARLFTAQAAEAFTAHFERIQTDMFGLVSDWSTIQKLHFMGQATSFFKFKNAIVTQSTNESMQQADANFSTKLPAILREALVARYSRFAGTLQEPVCFESRDYPRVAVILTEILTVKSVPKHIVSEPEKTAYKLCALLARRGPVKQEPAPPPKPLKLEVNEHKPFVTDDAWKLMWATSHRDKVRERVQTVFKLAFRQYKPLPILKAFGPAWMQ